MVGSSSKNQGCLIAVLIFLGLGDLLLFLDYGLLRAHSVPPFCTKPECESMTRFLDISAISSVAALGFALLAAFHIGPRALSAPAVGAMLVSVVAGFLTGVSLWSLPNAVVTLNLGCLLVLVAADD